MSQRNQRRKNRFFPFARKPKKINRDPIKSFTLYDPASLAPINWAFHTFRYRVNLTATKRKKFNLRIVKHYLHQRGTPSVQHIRAYYAAILPMQWALGHGLHADVKYFCAPVVKNVTKSAAAQHEPYRSPFVSRIVDFIFAYPKRWPRRVQAIVQNNLLVNRPWHILPDSPQPIRTAFAACATLLCVVGSLHYDLPAKYLGLSLALTSYQMFSWGDDVSYESRHDGFHTSYIKSGLKLGFIWFILSEIMFFLGFFAAQINLSIEPHVFIWSEWPPFGIQPVSPFGLALVTTAVLLSSGVTITWCQVAFHNRNYFNAVVSLGVTIGLSLVFLVIQMLEYNYFAGFNINDSVYGSCFYMITGLHGFHVIVGTLILGKIFLRLTNNEFATRGESIGLTTGAWYWHFVDVVWLFVLTLLYILNSAW